MKRAAVLFCSFLPFTFLAGAVLPVSAILPLSLIWTFSGRKWFALAGSMFLALRISDLQSVYLFLVQTMETFSISPALVQPITAVAMAVVLTTFLVEAWLIKRWAEARISKFAPRLFALGQATS